MSANVALSDTFDQWRVKTNELMAMTQTGGMANFIKSTDTTNATSNTTGSIITAGGAGIAKSVVIGEHLNVHGNIHANGQISADGNLTLGSDDTDSVDFNADIASHIIPNVDTTYNIGNSTMYWANAYINTVELMQETASGKPGLKVTGADADQKLVEIVGSQTTNDILYVNASALTSGSAFVINQDLADATTRTLAKIIQNHTGATETTALAIQSDAGRGIFVDYNYNTGGFALEIDDEHTTSNVAKIATAATSATILDIQAEAITTGKGINWYDDSLTTGSVLYIDSNSADTSGALGTTGRSVAQIIQNHASATTSTALLVQNDSNVGLGIDVRGGIGTGGAPAGKIRLSTAETSIVDGDVLGMIQFVAPLEAGGTDAIAIAACIQAEADDTFAADNNATELVFKTAASEAATEKVRFTSDGKVGIGTAAPDNLLHLFKTSGSVYNKIESNDDSVGLLLDGVKTSDGGVALIQFYNAGDSVAKISADRIGANDAADLTFHTQVASGSQAQKMVITSAGNVGIGTAVPGLNAAGVADIDPLSNFAGTLLHIDNTGGDASLVIGGSDQPNFAMVDGNSSANKRYYHQTVLSDVYKFRLLNDAGSLVNDNLIVLDGHNARVGLGTAAPASRLDVRGTVQVGVDDTGHDVKFFGATASKYWMWDESADKTILAGDSDITGTLTVNGAGVFNEASADVDFRVESNASTHALFVDGGVDSVGFGQSSPLSGSKIDVGGAIAISAESSTPSQPADGKGFLYSKAGGKLYWRSYDETETDLTGGGAETAEENIWTAQQTFNDQALTSGTSVSWNANTAQVATLTLGHNATVATATNQKAGGVYIMRVTQAAAAKTLAWSTGYKWPGNTAPTMSDTAGAVDIFTFTSDGTYMYGSFSGSQNYT